MGIPPIFLTGTQGERLRYIPLSPLLRFCVQYPAILLNTAGRERIKRGISCFSIRVDFTLLHYNIREGANKLSDNTLSKCSIYVVSKRATSFFYSNRGSRRVVFGHLGRNIPKDFYRTKIGALLSSREFSVALFFD